MSEDRVGQGVDRLQGAARLRTAFDAHAVAVLHLHADLQRVQRVELERAADQELVVPDLVDRDVPVTLDDDQVLQVEFQSFPVQRGHDDMMACRQGLCARRSGVTIGPVTSRRLLYLAGLTILAAAACDRIATDPGARAVAKVGDRQITAAELQVYLDANQFQDPAAEPAPPGDLARVKSRLFDDYLDGELMLQEAQRRRLTVPDAELAEYLGQDAPPSPALRELARRDLAIQKLRESVVLATVHVKDAEIDAWLAAKNTGREPALQGTLRTLRLASYPEAMRVRQEILAKKLSFAAAGEAYGADSLPDTPRDEDLVALPPAIATAIKGLQPGQVSAPLPFESSVLLFLLEKADDPSVAESRRREAARRALALEKSQAAADELLAELKSKTVVIRHLKELPFVYVAEDAAPRAK